MPEHRLEPVAPPIEAAPPEGDEEPIPPLMRKLLAEYAAPGLPPAYLPKHEPRKEDDDE